MIFKAIFGSVKWIFKLLIGIIKFIFDNFYSLTYMAMFIYCMNEVYHKRPLGDANIVLLIVFGISASVEHFNHKLKKKE
jgi:hypothetical protein